VLGQEYTVHEINLACNELEHLYGCNISCNTKKAARLMWRQCQQAGRTKQEPYREGLQLGSGRTTVQKTVCPWRMVFAKEPLAEKWVFRGHEDGTGTNKTCMHNHPRPTPEYTQRTQKAEIAASLGAYDIAELTDERKIQIVKYALCTHQRGDDLLQTVKAAFGWGKDRQLTERLKKVRICRSDGHCFQ